MQKRLNMKDLKGKILKDGDKIKTLWGEYGTIICDEYITFVFKEPVCLVLLQDKKEYIIPPNNLEKVEV